MMHNLLEISLAPSVPASLRNIPEKYNIIIQLWTYDFHCLFENLRHSSLHSKVALEHLQDFIYYAYTFYTGLLEEPALSPFKSGWLEALGDLARYRMAIAAMVTQPIYSSTSLTVSAVRDNVQLSTPSTSDSAAISSVSDKMVLVRIDDSPSPSVGIVAVRQFSLAPEKETWRAIAREWYGLGVGATPGNGKLHHHLGLLS